MTKNHRPKIRQGDFSRTLGTLSLAISPLLIPIVSAELKPALAREVGGYPCHSFCEDWLGRGDPQAVIKTGTRSSASANDHRSINRNGIKVSVERAKFPLPRATGSPLTSSVQLKTPTKTLLTPITAPSLAEPRYDLTSTNQVDLAWKSVGFADPVRYFVEIKNLAKAKRSTDVFAGFVEDKRLHVTLPEGEGAYIWRVAIVEPKARRYAQSAWGILEIHPASALAVDPHVNEHHP